MFFMAIPQAIAIILDKKGDNSPDPLFFACASASWVVR